MGLAGQPASQPLGGANRQALADDAIAEVPAPLGIDDGQQDLGVAGAEAGGLDVLLELPRQLEQPLMVRDARPIELTRKISRFIVRSALWIRIP